MIEEEFFGRLRKQYELNLPFVAYRKSSEGKVKALLQQNSELFTTENFTESGFVFAPFDNLKIPVLIPENASEKLIMEWEVSEEISAPGNLQVEEMSEAKKMAHIQLVEKAVSLLKVGEMAKVVLSRKEEVTIPQINPVDLFRDLLKVYPDAFVYLWFHPETGCWLAATPETLLKVEGNRFKTMALAGTQRYTGSLEVFWGDKEKEEQQYVTDSILENLKKVGISLKGISWSETYTAKAGNLLHLRTDISGRLNDSNKPLKDILSALHPTPAVCGLPKKKAKDFILAEEGYDREFYTGFLGELNLQKNVQRSRTNRNVENLAYRAVKKETDLFVNLRCMKIEAGKAVLFIGGGITKDSKPEEEWEETVNKSQTMKKVLLKL